MKLQISRLQPWACRTIIPFISLDETKVNHPDSVRLRNNLLTNFQPGIRFPTPPHPVHHGNHWSDTNSRQVDFRGLTAEKDAGEKLFSGNLPSDFFSANLHGPEMESSGDLFSAISVPALYGYGINTGSQDRFVSYSIGIPFGSDEIRPYTSTDENIFFRGTAVQFQIKQTGLSLFIQLTGLMQLSRDRTRFRTVIETFYRSGLHNTSPRRKEDAVTDMLWDKYSIRF